MKRAPFILQASALVILASINTKHPALLAGCFVLNAHLMQLVASDAITLWLIRKGSGLAKYCVRRQPLSKTVEGESHDKTTYRMSAIEGNK